MRLATLQRIRVPSPIISGGGGDDPLPLLKENNMNSLDQPSGWYEEFSDNRWMTVVDGGIEMLYKGPSRAGGGSIDGGDSPNVIGTGIDVVRELELEIAYKWSADYKGHSSNVNKCIHIFVRHDDGNASNRVILSFYGALTDPIRPTISYQNIINRGVATLGTFLGDPDVGWCAADESKAIVRGNVEVYKLRLRGNTEGNADGWGKLYKDDELIVHQTGIRFYDQSVGCRFSEVAWSPTYGGGVVDITASPFNDADGFTQTCYNMKLSGQ